MAGFARAQKDAVQQEHIALSLSRQGLQETQKANMQQGQIPKTV